MQAEQKDKTITLYRPVGHQEMMLIEASGCTAFPPRLPEQPFFYPVLNEQYATQIARDWNARYNDPPIGYVTRFRVRADYLSPYEIHVVGGEMHQEYWIPADDLDRLNQNIVGRIEVLSAHRPEEKPG
jgi:hypothetical protein